MVFWKERLTEHNKDVWAASREKVPKGLSHFHTKRLYVSHACPRPHISFREKRKEEEEEEEEEEKKI